MRGDRGRGGGGRREARDGVADCEVEEGERWEGEREGAEGVEETGGAGEEEVGEVLNCAQGGGEDRKGSA